MLAFLSKTTQANSKENGNGTCQASTELPSAASADMVGWTAVPVSPIQATHPNLDESHSFRTYHQYTGVHVYCLQRLLAVNRIGTNLKVYPLRLDLRDNVLCRVDHSLPIQINVSAMKCYGIMTHNKSQQCQSKLNTFKYGGSPHQTLTGARSSPSVPRISLEVD